MFDCKTCNIEFASDEDLNTHMLFGHFFLMPTCTIQNKESKEIQSLRRLYKFTLDMIQGIESSIRIPFQLRTSMKVWITDDTAVFSKYKQTLDAITFLKTKECRDYFIQYNNLKFFSNYI